MIKKAILDTLNKELKEQNAQFSVNQIEESSFGDYSTSFPLKLGRFKEYQNPVEIAKFFVSRLSENDLFSEVTFTEPGFINFTINQKEAGKLLSEVIRLNDTYGSNKDNYLKKARIEFVSANPTGPLHIGNARGGPLGDSLASILSASGYIVIREYLHNNVGNQVENLGQSLLNLVSGGKLEEQEYKGEYLLELVKSVPENLKTAVEIGTWATAEILKEVLKDLEKIGIKYDKIYQESDFVSSKTSQVLKTLEAKQVLKKSEGATWFAPNDNFMSDREAVVIRSDGKYTYFANDIAYHNEKFNEGYDLVVDELGSGHDGHVPKLRAAILALGFDEQKFKVIVHQNVRVKRGSDIVKMSKRAGNYVTAAEVIDEVGSDAFRFLLLMHSPNSHLDFDLDLAKQKTSENPVYYVQYAHARICSILNKSEVEFTNFNPGLLSSDEEKELALKTLELSDLVSEIAGNFQVHQLAHYTTKLSDLFHSFYEKHKVLSEDQELTKARLALVAATKISLKNALTLLGVSAPEHM